MDAIPALTPGYGRPTHQGELIAELDRVPYEQVLVDCNIPPRFFKSTTVHHAIAKWLAEHPWLRILYVTYATEFADENVAAIRDLCVKAGVVLGRTDREGKFTTKQSGGVTGGSFSAPLNGRGFHVIIIDDPHKNRTEAESRAIRTKVNRAVTNDVVSRGQPSGPKAYPRGFPGTSVFCIGTRWHVDDVHGNLLGTSPSLAKRGKTRWKHIVYAAINARGESLAPDYWPIEKLRELRDDYEAKGQLADWLSLFQQDPQPEGGQKFRDIMLVRRDAIPASGRYAIGVDLAHTSTTRSDLHAAAKMMRAGDSYYLLDLVARRGPLTTIEHPGGRHELGFVQDIRAMQATCPGARTAQHFGGPEDTTLELLGKLEADERVHVEGFRTQTDKLQRAHALIADWNKGRVLVPDDAEWASALMSKLISFTGAKGGADDEIDAIVTAHWLLSQGDGLTVLTPGGGPATYRDAPPTTVRGRGRGFFAG